ncbi:MAG: response regulator [candidate division Zixibacteria bacterium]|nr:response regulator [candidate division Zixibacteria bacterium]
MHKRILIIEAADAIRGIAENILRQNGYEVISVSNAEKAMEVLQFTTPDLILVSADMTGTDQQPLYMKIKEDAKTASVPLLFFAGVEKTDLPFPEEIIIPRPFDPQDLVQRVRIFSGQAVPDNKKEGTGPAESGDLEDDLLDAALGIDTKDNIQITDSEVMDRTTQIKVGKQQPSKSKDKMIGYDHFEEEDADEEHTKIESLMIEEDNSEISRKPSPSKAKQKLSGTSKLEIMSDQYGLQDPDAFKEEDEARAHDYDWFVNSMREETNKPSEASAPTAPKASDSQEISFTEPSDMVDPITPPPSQKPQKPTAPAKGGSSGVEKFIDEFKKEVERIHSNEPETVVIDDVRPAQAATGKKLEWEEKLEKVTPEQVNLFTRQFTLELAERIAEKIAAKIDPNKLTQLIKNEIIAHIRNKK